MPRYNDETLAAYTRRLRQDITRQRHDTIASLQQQIEARHRRNEWNRVRDAEDHETILLLGGPSRSKR